MQKNMRQLLVAAALVVLPSAVAAQQTHPLVVVDGVVVGSDSTATQVVNRFTPSDILSIDVIKGAVAGELYGSRARGGVIIIRTKAGTGATAVSEQQRQWLELLTQMRSADQLAPSLPPQPLIVVDGVIVGRGHPAGLDALRDRIERIEVVKGAAAVAAYGPAGAAGVILIITK